MSEKIRVGIIGCGLISRLRHVPTYKKLAEKVEIASVCDLDEKLASSLAEDFSIPAWYKDVNEMLSKENLDLVDICVPPKVHSSVALSAIENGCHTFIEKPMALTTAECQQMVDAAKRKNVKIGINHNNLFHPAFIKAKKAVDEGKIGDIAGMRIYLSTPRHDMLDLKDHWYHRLPGGMIGETGPHIVYMTQAFIRDITNVDIMAKNLTNKPWAPHDEFRIEMEGSNGLSSVALSYTRDAWAATMDLFGTKGSLNVDLNTMLVTNHSLRDMKYTSIAKTSLGTIPQILGGFTGNVMGVAMKKNMVGTQVHIESFIQSINNGSVPPITGEMGLETVRVMESIVNKYRNKYSSG